MAGSTLAPPPTRLAGSERVARVWDPVHDCWTAKILPGEFCVTAHGESLTAVVGASVSACVRDSQTGIGGMNQFVLPGGEVRSAAADERGGALAMARLIDAVLRHGCGRHEALEIKLVGGASPLGMPAGIGERTIDFVRRFTAADGLRVVGEDLGGDQPRRIVYFPETGLLRVRKLKAVALPELEEERAHGASLLTSRA